MPGVEQVCASSLSRVLTRAVNALKIKVVCIYLFLAFNYVHNYVHVLEESCHNVRYGSLSKRYESKLDKTEGLRRVFSSQD